ncbi:hypothetical protein CPCC7001_1716 [Cyanobium sp. PCC 7001]|nr:hypothetical protein CPCC7001_1716 [Cyanobium sp. PCC 7001]
MTIARALNQSGVKQQCRFWSANGGTDEDVIEAQSHPCNLTLE